jgi:phosphatidylcholine synthase
VSPSAPGPARQVAAWGVHLLTASSAAAGVLALRATVNGDASTAFLWMAYTIVIDSIDGTLARAVGVKEVLPWIDGARLDDLVDYFTYVVVPVFLLLQMRLLPPELELPLTVLVTAASGYGFSQTAAKTPDHFFTGFPSYWNIVAFYLYVLGWPPALNAAILAFFAVGVFVPLRYVYPSRTPTLRRLTVTLGIAWGVAIVWALLHLGSPAARTVVVASLAYVAYYFALSIVLDVRGRG